MCGRADRGERLPDVLLGRAVVAHDLLIPAAELATQGGEVLGGLAPRLIRRSTGEVVVSRIVVVRVHLLDGTYELFRAYYGVPPRTSPDGREVGAIRGLIETTLALLRQPDVTHLAVATDTVITSFRNDMFEGYKTGEGIEAELVGQFHLADRIFSAMGVVLWDMIDFEADDAMATAAARWADDVEQVVILSPDKDMAQCVVGEQVVTYDRRNQKMYGFDDVVEKFGVEPASIPDYLALVGDTADGVPGLPGWGAKSSSTVLARYRHLEEIPASADDWDVSVRSAAKLAATLAERVEDVMLYRDLTRLRTDVPLTESLEDLEWKGVRRDEFLAMCDELGFDGETRDRPHRWQ